MVSVHPLTAESFALRSFNFFTDESELRHVWHRDRGRIKSARQVFTDQARNKRGKCKTWPFPSAHAY